MAEVFNIWGTFELREEGGNIDRRITEITNAARDARRPLSQVGDGLDEVGQASSSANRQIGSLSGSLDDAGRAASDTVRPLTDVGSAAGESSGMVGDLIQNFGGLTGAATGVAGVIGGLLIAAIVDGINYSRDLEVAISDVARKTNATAKETEGYKQSMENLFKEGFSNDIVAIGDAHNQAALQTSLHGKELEEVTKKTMFLSERLGTDYGETIKVVDGMVRNYGITHAEAFDIIAKGYDENLNVGGDLLDLFSEYGPILQQIGIDENDMLSIMVSAREKGIFSYDQLLAGAQEFNDRIQEMLADEEASTEFFNKLGLKSADVKKAFEEGGQAADTMRGQIYTAVNNITGDVERASVGTQLYGEGWLVTGGKINEVMLNSQYRSVETGKTMDKLIKTDVDPLAQEWNKFYNSLKADTLEPVGKLLNKSAADMLKWSNSTAEDIVYWTAYTAAYFDVWQGNVRKSFNGFISNTKTVMDKLPGILRAAARLSGNDFNDIVSQFTNKAIDKMKQLKNWVDPVTSAFELLAYGIGLVLGKISKIKFPSKPGWIPGFATGVENFGGGLAMVGERGPELVYLPPRTNVYSNQDTGNMLNNLKTNSSTINNLSTLSTTGGNTFNVNMQIAANSIKEVSDLLDLFNNLEASYISQ